MSIALVGKSAERFIKKADENLAKRGSVDFSKQMEMAERILEKANLTTPKNIRLSATKGNDSRTIPKSLQDQPNYAR